VSHQIKGLFLLREHCEALNFLSTLLDDFMFNSDLSVVIEFDLRLLLLLNVKLIVRTTQLKN